MTGWRLRLVAFLSAGLLAVFGTAMALSFGIKEPLDYSVFSASAAALLLGLSAEGHGAPVVGAQSPLAARSEPTR